MAKTIEPYDPAKHKGYIILIKQGQAFYIPPAKVPGFRSQGWKTEAEYAKAVRLKARKANKGKPTIMDTIVNAQTD